MTYYRLINLTAVVLFSILFSAQIIPQQQVYDKIRAMSDSISLSNLDHHIRVLERAGGHYSRVTLTAGNDSGRQYISNTLRAIPGLAVTEDTFYISNAPSPYNTKPIINVIADIPGTNPNGGYYILGAHYDCSASRMGSTVWNQQYLTIRAPGADDNATGVAGLIEMARVLSDTSFGFRPEYSIKLVAFAAEESSPGYTGSHLGSKDYATRAFNRGDVIHGMISLDMVGYNNTNYYTAVVSNQQSQLLGEKMIEARDLFNIDILMNQPPFVNATYSDHDQFWAKGYKAILVIENAPPWNNGPYYTANPLYHTSYDSAGSVNLELVKRVTQLNLVTLSSFASRLTDVDDTEVAEKNIELYSNYPNPFKDVTRIRYAVGAGMKPDGVNNRYSARVVIKVYDVLGKEAATLLDEEMEPGTYQVEFNGAGLASGIYYYRIQQGAEVKTRKMVLVR
ncbi:MAG: M20/M25/M40 family metallo-hydrolase [Ignavibacteriaceae bacterium]|nr:M20/M25/M40 family metallo-hydrolase [Ignavibacteriaceae bacterium]